MYGGNIHPWVQDILETSVQFDRDQNNTKLQTVLASQNTQHREKQVILSMIRSKTNESVPQEGNGKTSNLREHTCKVKWDGLYSRDAVSKKYHQHGRGKSTYHEQSTGRE